MTGTKRLVCHFACISHDDIATASASASKKPINCRPSGMPPSSNNGSDKRRHAEQRGRHAEFRIAGRGKALRRGAGRGQRDAAVAACGKRRVNRADTRALFDVGAVVGERQMLVFVRAFERNAAELAGAALAHGAKEPSRLEAVAAVRQFRCLEEFVLERRNVFIVMAVADRHAGGFQPRDAVVEALLGGGATRRPSRPFPERRASSAFSPPAHCAGLAGPACRHRRRHGRRSRRPPARRRRATRQARRCSSGSG